MEKFEQYIKENIGKFNEGDLPYGDKELFNRKLYKRNNYFTMFSSVAAILIAGIFIYKMFSPYNNIIDYKQEMLDEASLVMQLAKKTSPFLEEETLLDINSILFEKSSFIEELPDELTIDEKVKILKEYYKAKTEGLKKLKIFLAQETLNNE